jgi:required for meiotic nuclear division protein 1
MNALKFTRTTLPRQLGRSTISPRLTNPTTVFALRSLYTTTPASSSSSAPKQQKPRDSTPLRRAARDSLPIRANPTPTRGNIEQVTTLATAERFVLPNLRDFLPKDAQPLAEAWWVPRWGNDGKEGEIFVFSNGSFVCWGLTEQDARRFGKEVIAKAGAQVSALKEPETEELDFVTDPNEYVYCVLRLCGF